MKVIFLPNNIASLASCYAKELSLKGLDAKSYNLTPSYKTSPMHVENLPSSHIKKVKYFVNLLYDIFTADIIHWLYGGKSIPTKILLFIISFSGAKKVVEYCGSDIRNTSKLFEECQFLKPEMFSDSFFEHMGSLENSKATQKRFSSHSFTPLISYPELRSYIKDKHFFEVRRSVDESVFNKNIDIPREIPHIIHAPSNTDVKGTKFIVNVLDELSNESLITYELLTNTPHNSVLEKLNNADLVIDQLIIGDYGVYAIEALANSTPVICFIKESVEKIYLEEYEEFPIINANITNLEEKIIDYINLSMKEKENLSKKSYNFAYKYHHAQKNVEELIKIYQKILNK